MRVKLMLSFLVGFVFGASLSFGAEKTMGVPQYAIKRAVKVCATYPTLGNACGTGMLLGQGRVLTEHHIFDTATASFIQISSTGFRVVTIQENPISISVLREDGQEFVPAIVISSSPTRDLGILGIDDDVTPAIIFDNSFQRGQEVYVIGNPTGQDFKVVKTKITGVFIYGDRHLVMVDSQDNQIRGGFSGGGIFNKSGGLIGLLEVCGREDQFCAGISSTYIQTWLNQELNW